MSTLPDSEKDRRRALIQAAWEFIDDWLGGRINNFLNDTKAFEAIWNNKCEDPAQKIDYHDAACAMSAAQEAKRKAREESER